MFYIIQFLLIILKLLKVLNVSWWVIFIPFYLFTFINALFGILTVRMIKEETLNQQAKVFNFWKDIK